MSHPFGELLARYRARKVGLSQAKLARAAGYDPSLLAKMCQGKKELTGPSGRDRVVRILGALRESNAVTSLDDANALLTAASMQPLFDRQPAEAKLIEQLRAFEKPRHTPNNLPASLTSFVGRETDIAALAARIRMARLLTLTGVGGVGKTRLALEVAIKAMPTFADAVWWIDLASLSDSTLLLQTAVATLKLPEQTGRTHLDTLLAYLEPRNVLLIFDNCEHLIHACAELIERLLRDCPRVHVLATSRETLRLPGEVTHRVPPLTIPDLVHLSPERLLNFESAHLFVERAAMQPTFDASQLTTEDAYAIAQVCRQLDGIPLALELAAALTQTITVEEIAARLGDQLVILTDGFRTSVPRHQTMRSALDWSFGLLPPAEQRLLARLSVFAGGWTIEAAQSIGTEASPAEVLSHLNQLVRKSLVVAQQFDGHTRYRLLEPIRQYAAAKLDDMGERDVAHERHFSYFLEVAQQAYAGLTGWQHWEWIKRLEADHDNLRAALSWSQTRSDQADAGLSMAVALSRFWQVRDYVREGVTWLQQTLARPSAPKPIQAKALFSIAQLWRGWGDWQRLSELKAPAEQCLVACREMNDEAGIAYALLTLGFVAQSQNDSRRAYALGEESLKLFETVEDVRGVYLTHCQLATTLSVQGQHQDAAALLKAYVGRFQDNADPWYLTNVLLFLADELMLLEDRVQASAHYERCLGLAEGMNSPSLISDAFGQLEAADHSRALVLAERYLARVRERKDKLGMARALHHLGGIVLDSEDYERGGTLLDESIALWRELGIAWGGSTDGAARPLIGRGQAARFAGRYELAIACFDEGINLFRQADNRCMLAIGLLFRGYATLTHGDVELAATHIRESVKLICEGRYALYLAPTLANASEVLRERGRPEQAARLIGAAMAHSSVHLLRGNIRWDYDCIIAAACSRLGDPAYAAVWAEGQAMTFDQAVDYALSVI